MQTDCAEFVGSLSWYTCETNKGERHDTACRDVRAASNGTPAKQGRLGRRGSRLVRSARRTLEGFSSSKRVDDPKARSAAGGYRARTGRRSGRHWAHGGTLGW